MTEKQTSCSVCGATLEKKTITYTQPIGDTVYLVTGVPAEVCTQCGEEYLTPETVDALQEITHTGKVAKTLEVPVYPFSTAASA